MRLATLRLADATTRAAVADGDDWVLLDAPDVGALVAATDWRAAVDRSGGEGAERVAAADAAFATPIARPAKIVCCGLNYADHIAETGRETPTYPTLFAKFADTLTDPDAAIEVVGSEKVDWEAELTVVVGRPVHRASVEEARDAILGYTVANDVSMRDWQQRTLQWFQGKAFDDTTPVGPVVVTADEIDPVAGLDIVAEVDGEAVQTSNTRELVFDAATLVAYVSQIMRLAPGDLVLTGTPGGVGLGREPQRFLADGETLTTRIEGIGELRNTIRIHASKEQQA